VPWTRFSFDSDQKREGGRWPPWCIDFAWVQWKISFYIVIVQFVLVCLDMLDLSASLERTLFVADSVLAEFAPTPIFICWPRLEVNFLSSPPAWSLGSPASKFSLRQGIPLVRSVASLSTKNRFCPFLASALVGAVLWLCSHRFWCTCVCWIHSSPVSAAAEFLCLTHFHFCSRSYQISCCGLCSWVAVRFLPLRSLLTPGSSTAGGVFTCCCFVF
jgi:hypothetical protein